MLYHARHLNGRITGNPFTAHGNPNSILTSTFAEPIDDSIMLGPGDLYSMFNEKSDGLHGQIFLGTPASSPSPSSSSSSSSSISTPSASPYSVNAALPECKALTDFYGSARNVEIPLNQPKIKTIDPSSLSVSSFSTPVRGSSVPPNTRLFSDRDTYNYPCPASTPSSLHLVVPSPSRSFSHCLEFLAGDVAGPGSHPVSPLLSPFCLSQNHASTEWLSPSLMPRTHPHEASPGDNAYVRSLNIGEHGSSDAAIGIGLGYNHYHGQDSIETESDGGLIQTHNSPLPKRKCTQQVSVLGSLSGSNDTSSSSSSSTSEPSAPSRAEDDALTMEPRPRAPRRAAVVAKKRMSTLSLDEESDDSMNLLQSPRPTKKVRTEAKTTASTSTPNITAGQPVSAKSQKQLTDTIEDGTFITYAELERIGDPITAESRNFLFPPSDCETCKRGIKRLPDMVRHVETVHLGIRREWCDGCGMRLARKDSLRRHRLKCKGPREGGPLHQRASTADLRRRLEEEPEEYCAGDNRRRKRVRR